MDLKLTEHVRNTISLPYKQKTGWNSDIWNFFSEKINFGLYFTENRHFQVGHVLLRHCDVIRRLIFMILVSMERRAPTPYYGTKQLYFGVSILSLQGVVTIPLRKTCYKKCSGRRGSSLSALVKTWVMSSFRKERQVYILLLLCRPRDPSFVQECDCSSHVIDQVDFGLTRSNSGSLDTLTALLLILRFLEGLLKLSIIVIMWSN